MALAAAYAAPFRASIWPAALKRTIAAKSAYPAAAPADSPVTPSIDAPFGVASNCAVKDPVWAVNGLFSHASELVLQPGCGACTVTVALPLMLATAVLLLAHVTVRPDNGAPFASFGVAVSCTVPLTWTEAAAGATLTEATGVGHVTVRIAVSDLPPGWLVAVT